MPSLTSAERDALRRAVSVHGRAWDVIVASGACPGRGARTLRWNWGEICKEGVVAAAGLAAEPVWHPLVEGPGLPVVPLPDKLRAKTARCIHSGRPWNYIVQRGGERDAPREPTALQWGCVHNWSLDNARDHGLLICNLKRASAKLRRYLARQNYTHAPLDVLMTMPIPVKLRDQLGMVVYPGQAGATVTRGCAGLNWLGGECMGEGRFATSREIAGFMGISSRLGPYRVALRHYSDYQVCSLLAEAVHSKVSDFAATVASYFLSPAPATVGSLYSGAFDELGTGCQRIFPGLKRSFVAESDSTKLRVLWESFAPDRCYSDVCEVDGCYPADILVASPPCLVFSKANRTSTVESQVDTARGQVAALRRAVRLLAPRAVILEQTSGLRSHCVLAYEEYLSMWDGLGYRVFHSPVDAHDNCGASHHRSRLIWVALLEV